LFAAAFAETRAHAAQCGAGPSPVVLVQFSGEPWDESLERGVLDHLRAGLGPAGFQVCLAADADVDAHSVATVELRQNAGEHVAATIEVRDGVTEKRVARDIDLAVLPADGRAFGVGVAADELLRASWVELSLSDAPKPKEAPPPAVEKSVRAVLHRDEPRTEVGIDGVLTGYSGRLLLLGGDARVRHFLTRRFAFELALGVSEARDTHAAHGSVGGSAVTGEVSAVFEIARAGGVHAALSAGLFAADLRFHGDANGSGTGASGSAVLLSARAGAGFTFDVTHAFAILARSTVGVPLRAVSAQDDGHTAVAASGLEWSAALGPEVVF
jgi:hypothetical protein